MQSVELLLDAAGTERVVAQWDALAAADLPSQAQHQGATNAPHVTIGLASTIDEGAETALGDLAPQLPFTLHLGPVVLFGAKNSLVLARLVIASTELLGLHASVTKALELCPGQVDHLHVGRWVPHVTLAQRIRPEAMPEALTVLRRHEASKAATQGPDPQTLTAQAVQLRRWDSEAKRAWIVAGNGHALQSRLRQPG